MQMEQSYKEIDIKVNLKLLGAHADLKNIAGTVYSWSNDPQRYAFFK